jgi:hypothetical protein
MSHPCGIVDLSNVTKINHLNMIKYDHSNVIYYYYFKIKLQKMIFFL